MKLKTRKKKKFIARIIEFLIIIASIILTIKSIKYANAYRGYKAVGGEYLIFPFGLMIVLLIEDFIEYLEEEENKKHGKHRK